MPDPIGEVISSAPEWVRALYAVGVSGLIAGFAYALYKGWLVPKRILDATNETSKAELEAVRTTYERRLTDDRAEFDQRLGEWRRFRDEERARAIESDQHLRAQVEITKELGRSLSEARVELGRIAGLLGHLAEQHSGESGPGA
jgi:hypothetical protein